jgi:RHH-type rel operon transcriptional repressor/antitoxin RelB
LWKERDIFAKVLHEGAALMAALCIRWTRIADGASFASCHQSQERPMFTIRLPEEIEARLESLARRTGRSKTCHAREAIVRYLDDLEDMYLAEQVMLRIESGEEGASSLEEVEARLGLA